MLDLLKELFSSGSFIPHGHCFLWQTELVWLHVLSDAAIALAYYSIPLTLTNFIQRRKDLPFNWVFILFAAFITACGTSHMMSVWTLWHPTYWLSGGVKAITAVVSLSTAIALFPLIPKALAIPSSRDLEIANWALQQEMMERQSIQKELTHTQELREAIFNESADALFLVDPQTLLTLDCNRRAVELFQANDKSDLIGIEGQSLQRHQFSADELEAIVSQIQRQGFWSQELEYVTRQGNCFWGNIAAKPITVAERTFNLVRVTDITNRKQIETEREQAEQALKISESRYRAIVEDQTELIARFLADGTLVFVNGSYCRYFGVQPEDVLGRSYEPTIFEDDREAVAQLVQSMNAENTTTSIENRLIVKGEVRWTQWNNRMLFDEQEKFVEFQSVGRDITERKALEREAQEGKKILDALMEYIPEGITIADAPDVKIRRVSQYGERLTGQTREVLEGIPVDQHVPIWKIFYADGITPALKEELPLTRAVQKGEIVTNEEWVICQPEGRKVSILCNAGPIRDQTGSVTGGVIAWRDVTELKQTEAQLQASLQEKEVLLKEIHHRVKNNLQIVYSLLRLQRRKLKDQRAANALLESQSRIESIALIHEKLYQSEDLARINLAEYIPSLATNLFSTYNFSHSQIALRTEIEPIFLDIDKAIRCGLIINELLSNSLKYAFPDRNQGNLSIDLQLFATSTEAEKPTVMLTMKDNGVGIPNHVDFSRPETLGLQLVQGFVGQLKGTLEMQCQGGTEFQIVFPG